MENYFVGHRGPVVGPQLAHQRRVRPFSVRTVVGPSQRGHGPDERRFGVLSVGGGALESVGIVLGCLESLVFSTILNLY